MWVCARVLVCVYLCVDAHEWVAVIMNESRHTHEWVTVSHVSHEWVTSHTWMSRCHHEWVDGSVSHEWVTMSHVSHEWVTSRTWCGCSWQSYTSAMSSRYVFYTHWIPSFEPYFPVCCSVLQYVAVCYSVFIRFLHLSPIFPQKRAVFPKTRPIFPPQKPVFPQKSPIDCILIWCVHLNSHWDMYAYTRISVYAYESIYIHIFLYVCICMYVHTLKSRMHMYKHLHMHEWVAYASAQEWIM